LLAMHSSSLHVRSAMSSDMFGVVYSLSCTPGALLYAVSQVCACGFTKGLCVTSTLVAF
jgi:hypothetical protein